MFPFQIVLGGDSRKSRVEIDDEQDALNRELEDEDREELGFLALSQYRDMLENNLNESSMEKSMLELFEQYNAISSNYEELAILYDEICSQVKCKMTEDAESCINAFSFEKRIPIDFSEKDTDKVLNKIREWLDSKYDTVSERMEKILPDCIEYGDNISIFGTNCKVYTLSFGELRGTPEAGSEEQIEVSLSLDKKILARGYVNLTVGYLNFDEDGGASDGIEDSIDYEVDDVLDALKELISDLKEEFNNELELAHSLEKCLENKMRN